MATICEATPVFQGKNVPASVDFYRDKVGSTCATRTATPWRSSSDISARRDDAFPDTAGCRGTHISAASVSGVRPGAVGAGTPSSKGLSANRVSDRTSRRSAGRRVESR
jgi:hypothetical protein